MYLLPLERFFEFKLTATYIHYPERIERLQPDSTVQVQFVFNSSHSGALPHFRFLMELIMLVEIDIIVSHPYIFYW
jgi:hypothetical protein